MSKKKEPIPQPETAGVSSSPKAKEDEGFAAEIPGDLIRLLRMLREHGSLNGLQDHAGSFQDDTDRLMRAMLLRNSRRNDKQKTGAPEK